MKKNKKKAKRITKQTQLRVRTGVKAGDACDDCDQLCLDQLPPCSPGTHKEVYGIIACHCFPD
jgi:hypothetical protein